MTGEPDNLAEAGTDNVETSNYDNPEDWTYYDPEEDNVEEQTAEGTDDEAEEVEAEDEAVETDDSDDDTEAESAEDDDEEQTPITATEDAVVQLDDGTTATVKDLIQGHMRQADYTRKSQENSQARERLEAEANRISRINDAFVEHLAGMIPAEPDPALALSDPGGYTAQKAQYDAVVAQIQSLVALGSEAKQVTEGMSEQDRADIRRKEGASLIGMFPEVKTPEGREKFFQDARDTAVKLGFTDKEVGDVVDHRIFALAHWAKRGLAAEAAKSKAKAKVKKAPPVTPRKPGQGAKQANRNTDAMEKLGRSGSIRDAMQVDFD